MSTNFEFHYFGIADYVEEYSNAAIAGDILLTRVKEDMKTIKIESCTNKIRQSLEMF